MRSWAYRTSAGATSSALLQRRAQATSRWPRRDRRGTNHIYSVGVDGQTVIDSQPAANATLAEDGDLLFTVVGREHERRSADSTGLHRPRRLCSSCYVRSGGGFHRHLSSTRVACARRPGAGFRFGDIQSRWERRLCGQHCTERGRLRISRGTVKLNASGTFSVSPQYCGGGDVFSQVPLCCCH